MPVISSANAPEPTASARARAAESTLLRLVERMAPRTRAEATAVAWETFSALLFISAVVPAVFSTPWPAVLFIASMVLSAAAAPKLVARGIHGVAAAGAIRAVAWPLSVSPLLPTSGIRALVAAFAFGLMAGGIRRALYRRWLDAEAASTVAVARESSASVPSVPTGPEPRVLAASLRARLAESAMVAGIVGGHVLLLFSVAFLRTESQDIFRAWWEIVPALAVIGTAGFTLAVRPTTSSIMRALVAGPDGSREIQLAGLAQAVKLPDLLSYVNFALWTFCTATGIVYFRIGAGDGSRPSPFPIGQGNALMQLGLGALFAYGVSFYQRGSHRDALAPIVDLLRRWTRQPELAEPRSLRQRMLRDFGLPLLFTGMMSLFSSIGLYRALGRDLPLREDFNAISALFASFAMLVLAALGVVARAARELSRPMAQLAEAADRVAHGKLEAAVPRVSGPIEVVGLGESVERMRERLAGTIAELERERAGLEVSVETRTAELRKALEDLKHAQAALVQGERMASIGELVSGVAHEINNPLNAIAGASAPLERVVDEVKTMIDAYRAAERELPAERRQELAELRASLDLDASLDDLVGISTVVRRATERSVRIVQNLKSFSRVSGERAPTDLHACLEETLMLLAPRLRHACITVTRSFGDLPLVTCRAGEMNQIFMNLFTNAIQALEAAKLDNKEIRVETRVDDGSAEIAIADNGPGVAADIKKRIFDPFFTTKPRGQGTGLGLSISTDIARRHGGTLELTSADRGARFACRIPLRS